MAPAWQQDEFVGLLFASVLRNQLQLVFEHVLVSLGHNPPARWMRDPEQTLVDLLTELPGKLTRLRQLSTDLPE